MFNSRDYPREEINTLGLDTEALDRSIGEIEKQKLLTENVASHLIKGRVESKSQVFQKISQQFQERYEVDGNISGEYSNKFFKDDVNLDQLKINDTPLDSEFE